MSVFGQSKPIKRKYRGIYTGQIPTYEVKMGTSTYVVNASEIKAYVDRDSIFLEIGTNRYASAYFIEKKENKYILTSPRDHSGIPEQFILDPKTKTIVRKGLYPQPEATLMRSGKLPRR
jgi:hypothetical protein